MATGGTRHKTSSKKRIREDLLPDTAKYATIDNEEFVMIPVADFGEWYEDLLDSAIAEERRHAGADAVPLDQLRIRLKAGKGKE